MQDRHVDQVMNVIRQVLNISNMPEAADRLRAKLQAKFEEARTSGLGKECNRCGFKRQGHSQGLCGTIRRG